MADVFLRQVPHAGDNNNDVRLYDPTIPDAPIVVGGRIYFRGEIRDARAGKLGRRIYYIDT